MSILPVARPRTDGEVSDPGPAIRRRRMGSLRAHALHRPAPLQPGVPLLVPRGVGRAGEDPAARRGIAHRQPCRRHPLGRPGHHARHRRGTGPTGLRHGRLLLQDHPGGGDHVVTDRGRARPSRQRLPAAARPATVGPCVPRGHEGDLEDLLGPVPPAAFRAGRVRGDRHEGGRAHRPHRRHRRRGIDAHPLPAEHRGPRPQPAVLPGDRQFPSHGAGRLRDLLPGQDEIPCPRSRLLRRGAGPRAVLEEPGDG